MSYVYSFYATAFMAWIRRHIQILGWFIGLVSWIITTLVGTKKRVGFLFESIVCAKLKGVFNWEAWTTPHTCTNMYVGKGHMFSGPVAASLDDHSVGTFIAFRIPISTRNDVLPS